MSIHGIPKNDLRHTVCLCVFVIDYFRGHISNLRPIDWFKTVWVLKVRVVRLKVRQVRLWLGLVVRLCIVPKSDICLCRSVMCRGFMGKV